METGISHRPRRVRIQRSLKLQVDMEALEELQFAIEGAIFNLNVEQLRQICPLLDIATKDSQTQRELVRSIQSFFRKMDTSQAGLEEKLKAVQESILKMGESRPSLPQEQPEKEEVQSLIDSHRARMTQLENDFQSKLQKLEDQLSSQRVEPKDELATPPAASVQAVLPSTCAPPLFRKELRISGQIGELNQKDRLSFSSLNHQIEAALVKGYSEVEVIESVVRAINPGLRLRSYLENLPNLTLSSLRTVLKAHFQEKDATEIYQELSQIAQSKGESPQNFVMRALDLRQRVILASEESTTGMRYDPQLVQSLFLQCVVTGLSNDNIRQDMKQNLTNDTSDEELLDRLTTAASLEAKRQQKTGMKPSCRVSVVTTQGDPAPAKTSAEAKPELPSAVAAQIAELKACVLALQGQMSEQQSVSKNGNRQSARPRGCPKCRAQGTGGQCQHCFKCGGDDHFAYGCRKGASKPSANSGNGPRAHQGDQV